MPDLASQLKNWIPSAAATLNGYRCYAGRIMKEAKEFERAGNHEAASARYEKMKVYCAERGIEYPPWSTPETCVFPAKEWSEGLANIVRPPGQAAPASVKKIGRGKGTAFWTNQNRVRSWTPERRAEARIHGQKLHAQHLLKEGKENAAKAFCMRNNLPWPPFPEKNLGGEVKHAPDINESSGIQSAIVSGIVAPVISSDPGSPATSTQSMSAGGHAAAGEPQRGGPTFTPSETAPADSLPPAPPENTKSITPEPKKKGQEASHRFARVHKFTLNPRMAAIRFEDGEKELGSLWIPRRPLRLGDRVEVEIERGTGPTAVYQVVRQKV